MVKTKNLLPVIKIVDEIIFPGHIREYLAKIIHSRYLNCQISRNFLQKRKFQKNRVESFGNLGKNFVLKIIQHMASLGCSCQSICGRIKPESASAGYGVAGKDNAHDPAIGYLLYFNCILSADLFVQNIRVQNLNILITQRQVVGADVSDL